LRSLDVPEPPARKAGLRGSYAIRERASGFAAWRSKTSRAVPVVPVAPEDASRKDAADAAQTRRRILRVDFDLLKQSTKRCQRVDIFFPSPRTAKALHRRERLAETPARLARTRSASACIAKRSTSRAGTQIQYCIYRRSHPLFARPLPRCSGRPRRRQGQPPIYMPTGRGVFVCRQRLRRNRQPNYACKIILARMS
jgi:hypothetical protein